MRKLLLLLTCIIAFKSLKAQNVGINATGVAPNVSAMLDIVSTDKGLLLPRVALTGVNDNTTIAGGNVISLLVYNTATAGGVVPGYYYWKGTLWTKLITSETQDGNGIYSGDGTAPADVDVTVTNNIDFDNSTLFIDGTNNKIGIGTSAPTERLDVNGQIKIRGGAPGVGKVLTSDASGLATWENPPAGGDNYLGEDYLGGIIFELFTIADGTQHGLVIAKTEAAKNWQTTISTTNATRSWDGSFNFGQMTNSTSKTYVSGLGAGWYLPSIDELSLLWQHRYYANKGLNSTGSTLLTAQDYWSSTEHSSTNAYYFRFSTGVHCNFNKTNDLAARAVKAF